MTTTHQAERQRAREILNHGVAMMRRVPVSDRARRMVERIAEKGMEWERYQPTGMHSEIATRNWLRKQLRDAQWAFVRYAWDHGGDRRQACRWAIAMASPFAFVFPDLTQRQCMRWVNRLENAQQRRAS
jgi:hypothetical protein